MNRACLVREEPHIHPLVPNHARSKGQLSHPEGIVDIYALASSLLLRRRRLRAGEHRFPHVPE
jgi:hypothetical protein